MGEPCKLHIGNLSYDCTEEAIREKFEKFGRVEQVIICTHRDTGEPRGFGFVVFEKEDDAKEAIPGLDGEELLERPMRVNPSRPRSEGGGGRSYGGGRGRGRGGGNRYGGGGDRYGGGGDRYGGGSDRYGGGGGDRYRSGGGYSSFGGRGGGYSRSGGGRNENY